MQFRSRFSANPNLARRCLTLLPAALLLMAALARGEDTLQLDCDDRPAHLVALRVDGGRYCPELVYRTQRNEALALTALAAASDGALYAASPARGEILALRDGDGDRLPDQARVALTGLTRPTGIDWRDGALYVLDGAKIWRLRDGSDAAEVLVADLPLLPGQAGGDLVVAPDGEIIVSLAAACSICEPRDAPSILAIAPDGGERRVLARGLRMPAGLALRKGDLWTTDSVERGVDAPDEINRVRPEAHFGWPWCVGARRRSALAGDFDCATTEAPALTLPTGSFPLGLAHYDHDALPALRDSLLLTLHGSRHRLDLRGYALAVIRFDEGGQPLAPEALIPWPESGDGFDARQLNYGGFGFWPERPLDVAVGPQGWIYLSMTGGSIMALRPA